MLFSYMKSAVRNLMKTRMFSILNILGLSIGICAFLSILHYTKFETSYDRFYPLYQDIYRVCFERSNFEGEITRFASCPPPLGPFIKKNFRTAEFVTRLFSYRTVASSGQYTFFENNSFFVEHDFFEIFKLKFISGGPWSTDETGKFVVITRSTAIKYFGGINAIGKTLTLAGKKKSRVIGVIEDIPANSHLKFQILISYNQLNDLVPLNEGWHHTGFYTYIRFKPDTNISLFEKKLNRLINQQIEIINLLPEISYRMRLQAVKDIHLSSHLFQEHETNGDKKTVQYLFLIGFFVIVMSWMNYISLSTSLVGVRAKEITLRKVIGASRSQLISQFLIETAIINFIAIILALILMEIVSPLFRNISGIPPGFSPLKQIWFWITLPLLFFSGIIFAGIFPAAILSSAKPIFFSKRTKLIPRKLHFRKILVILQFIIALVLTSETVTIFKQLQFLKSQSTGFDINRLMVIKTPHIRYVNQKQKYESFNKSLSNIKEIKNSCYATEIPGRQILWDNAGIFRYDSPPDFTVYMIIGVDSNYLNVFDLKLINGRNFSPQLEQESNSLILNETASKRMGFNPPSTAVGQPIQYWNQKHTVIGVVEDYYQQSRKTSIKPHILRPFSEDRLKGFFIIKWNTTDIASVIKRIKSLYISFFPEAPFEFFPLGDYYNEQYIPDELFGKTFCFFSVISIIIMILGVYGLAAFLVEQRTKEIGIRKILGASIIRIYYLSFKELGSLLIISFFVSIPISYVFNSIWLKEYANRIQITSELFLIPLFVVFIPVFMAIIWNITRTVLANPINALRYE